MPSTPPDEPARSTVVVVTWRGVQHIGVCLDALSTLDAPFELLIVDNASDDGTADVIAAHPLAANIVRLPKNRGYAGGIQHAVSLVTTEFVAWLNDDTEVSPDWLRTLEKTLTEHSEAAAVSSRLEYPDGNIQSLGVELTDHGYGKDIITAHGEPFSFCGGAALTRTALLRDIGGVPAEFFCYYEDTDTGWRFRLNGWDILCSPARVRHLHGVSTHRGSARFHHWNERNRLLMLTRCAPAGMVCREIATFAALTLVLPMRRARDRPANFIFRNRLRILADFGRLLPAALLARRRITRKSTVSRKAVWDEWAGR